MSAKILKTWLDGKRERVVWIEYEDYARRVFAGDPADWFQHATRVANTLAQARSVVKTEVLSIDIMAPFLAARDTHAEIKTAFENPGPRQFVGEVIDALAHRFATSLDLVLKVRTPLDLLGESASFDDLDDVSTALAGLIRALAEKPVAGLLLARANTSPLSQDECDAYATLIGAARHYGWVTALAFTATTSGPDPEATAAEVDVILYPELSEAAIAAESGDATRMGGGLTRGFWSGDAASVVHAGSGLFYGEVPQEAEPETVLARVKGLGL